MTAINIVCRPRQQQIMILTDGAHYLADGTLIGLAAKGSPVPSWPGYVVGRGPSVASIELGYALAMRFSTFDDLIAGVEDILPSEVAHLNLSHFDGAAAATIELVLAGFSKDRSGPEAYLIRSSDLLPPGMDQDAFDAMRLENNAAGRVVASGDAYKLERLPDVAVAPAIPQSDREASGYAGIDPDEPDGQVLNDLMLAIELQRQQLVNDAHFVGGMAVLTTITPNSISQRVVKRWERDAVGEPIQADPINWKAWRDEREGAAVASIDTAGMSRAKRELMERKARKGTLRSVS